MSDGAAPAAASEEGVVSESSAFIAPASRTGALLGQCLAYAWIAAIAAMFALPFLWPWRIRPISSFYSEWLSAFLLLLAALAALLHFAGDRSKPAYSVPLSGFVFLPLIAVIGLQYALGLYTYPSNALLPALLLSAASIAVVLGAASARHLGMPRLLEWIAAASIAGGLVSFSIQLLQLYGLYDVFQPWISLHSNGIRFASLGQPNHLSTYLNWCLVCTLYLYARGSLRPWAGVLLITILLSAIALTSSRTSWLQVVGIALAGGFFVRRMAPAARPRHWRWLLLLPLWYLAVTLALPYVGDVAGFDLRHSTMTRFAEGTLGSGRGLIYAQAWEIFRGHPLFGIGFEEMIFQQFMLMDRYERVLFDNSAHNLLLDLLTMTGLAGTLAFLPFFLLTLWRICRGEATLERTAMLLMLAILGIHALLEYPEWYAYFLLPAAFFLGCLETRELSVRRGIVSRTVPPIAVLYGLLLCVMLYTQYVQLQSLYGRYYAKNRMAESIGPDAVDALERFQRDTLFSGPAEFILAFNLALNEIALERKLEISRRAMQYLPEPNIVYRHVVLLALAGRQEEGIPYLARLKKVFPVAYKEVAAELARLAKQQPEAFGKIGAEVERLDSDAH